MVWTYALRHASTEQCLGDTDTDELWLGGLFSSAAKCSPHGNRCYRCGCPVGCCCGRPTERQRRYCRSTRRATRDLSTLALWNMILANNRWHRIWVSACRACPSQLIKRRLISFKPIRPAAYSFCILLTRRRNRRTFSFTTSRCVGNTRYPRKRMPAVTGKIENMGILDFS
jgi:hypothetical protein